jgi:hypothetical protein
VGADRVLRLADLKSLDISRAVVRTHVEAGRWTALPHRGLVLDNGPIDDGPAAWMRAVVEVGAGARLGGITALQAAGLQGFHEPLIHVWVAKSRSKQHIQGVRVHETRRWSAPDSVAVGIPRSSPAVATVQGALWSRSRRQALLALVMPIQQRLARPADVAAELSKIRRHEFRTMLQSSIGDIMDGAHSLGELDFAGQCRRRGLPEPSRQVVTRTSLGRVYLDVRWTQYGVAVEINGAGHDRLDVAMRDEVRLLDLMSAGDAAVPLSVLTLRCDPDPFFGALVRLLRSRGWPG